MPEQMLSVAEVFELEPGDEQNATWVNPGFIAVVDAIKETTVKKTGRPMNICTLKDQTGSAEISLTVFGPVKFGEGDVIEVSGQGLRRTEYKGLAQVSMGKSTEIHIVGASAHHEEQRDRAAKTEPAVDGSKPHINGQTVGMAVKEAIGLVSRDAKNIGEPDFWSLVHQTASTIIRLSNALEHGNLTPPLGGKAVSRPVEAPVSSGGRPDTPRGPKPLPSATGGVQLPKDDEDVSF